MDGQGWLEKHISLSDENFLSEGESRIVSLYADGSRVEVDDRIGRPRVKTAASEEALHEVAKIKPVPGRVYALVIGLGSTEFWGFNNNGDSFPENALLGLTPDDVSMSYFDRYAKRLPSSWGYRTFMKAHVFEEHKNSNPKYAIGGIHATFWNPRMHRVENLIWVDRLKGKRWAEKFDNGENVGTSMACKIPFDRCSICGNMASRKSEYCGHLKIGSPAYELRQIRKDGTPVVMINDFPEFFDESCVAVPAAPEAMTIMKVASQAQKAAQKKVAEIKKNGPDLPLDVMMDEFSGLYRSEKPLPKVVLGKLREIGLPAAAKAASMMGIKLRPSEVFYIANLPLGFEKQAADLDRKVLMVPPRINKQVVASIANGMKHASQAGLEAAVSLLSPFASSRSYQEPYITSRLIKSAASRQVWEPVSSQEQYLLGIYHSLYKAAANENGYDATQVSLAWISKRGEY